MNETVITCPNCQFEIPISRVLREQISQDLERRHRNELKKKLEQARIEAEERVREQSGLELEDLRRQLKEQTVRSEQARRQELQARERMRELEQKEQQMQQEIDEAVARRLDTELKKQLQQRLQVETARLDQEQRLLREQLERERSERKQAQEVELALRREKQELERKAQDQELELQRRIDAERRQIEQQLRERLADEQALKLREKEKQIEDLRQSLEDARRRSELGSQELQGEVLEQDLEDSLAAAFPVDGIEPVKKGARGADVLQRVINERLVECGSIIWEAKNARKFSPGWIPKLKDDQRAAGAAVAVLVTMALPEGIAGFGQKDGVWICDRAHALPLAGALRSQLLTVSQARAAATGVSAKLQLLYDYLSGDEFRHRVEAIVEAFTAMQEQVNRERRAMNRHWKEREKQIERVMLGTTGMYGDLQGIIGSAMQSVPALELEDGGELQISDATSQTEL